MSRAVEILKRRSAACWLLAGCALLASSAFADGASRQEASYTLTEARPGRSSAEHFRFDYRDPAEPGAKPPAVTRVVTILPRGARYDTSAADSCAASDAELMAGGANACPAGSAIGGGVITIDSGLPGPGRFLTADVEFFNNATDPGGEFIYLNTVRGSGARTVIRADVTRRRTITEVALLPGAPPDGGAIDTVDLSVPEVTRSVDGSERRYITTPPRCPKRGHWRTRVKFSYGDGVTQVARTTNPCRRGRS